MCAGERENDYENDTVACKTQPKAYYFFILFMLLASMAEMPLPTMLAGMIDLGVAGNDRNMILPIAVVMAVMALLAYIVYGLSYRNY